MADDKTTKTPEQPVTDSGPGKETPPAPPKEPEKVSVSSEPGKKTEPEVKNPQVSVYNFAEIMKEKKAEERAAAPGGEKPDPAKAEKPEKQPEAPKKAEEKPKEPEQPKRRGRPPKADKDKAAAPKPKAPAQKPEKAVKKEPEKKTAPTVQTAPALKGPEKPKDAPRRGKEQIVYIKLNELHAFKNHPFEVRDDEEMRAMVSSVKDKARNRNTIPPMGVGVKKRAIPSTARITEAIVNRTAQISNRNTSRAARRHNAKAKGATNIFSSIFIFKTSFIYPSYLYFIMPARGHKCCERLVNPVPNPRAMMAKTEKAGHIHVLLFLLFCFLLRAIGNCQQRSVDNNILCWFQELCQIVLPSHVGHINFIHAYSNPRKLSA